MWNKPIHVLGAGSIGLLWTASIRSRLQKYPITLLLRDHEQNRKKVVQDHLGLSWKSRRDDDDDNKTKLQNISLPVQFIRDPQHSTDTIQTLLVATKAHQAKQAVESVLDRFLLGNDDTDNKTQIIVLCNGALSVRDELKKLDNKLSLVLATTTHGAYLETQQTLIHAGYGTTVLEQNEGMVKLWNEANLNCSSITSQQMESVLWNKLAANCVINPLTSLFECTNGELLMEPSFFELQDELLTEVASVAEGIVTNPPTIDEMRQFVSQTIHATVHNKSSMYQDILANRTTEIQHLNGYVVRKARELGQECPANEDVCMRIAALAQKKNR